MVIPLVSIEAVARKKLGQAIQNLRICHHALVVCPPFKRPMHLNYQPIWRLDTLVIVAMLFLVPRVLHSLGDAIVPTHRVFEMLKHYDGPRSHRSLRASQPSWDAPAHDGEEVCRAACCGWVRKAPFRNESLDHGVTTMLTVFMLPALNRWIKNMHHYDLGINEPTFQYLATFYTSVLNAFGIGLGLVSASVAKMRVRARMIHVGTRDATSSSASEVRSRTTSPASTATAASVTSES